MTRRIATTLLPLTLLWHTGCRSEREWAAYDCSEERERFEQRYNRNVREELARKQAELEEALAGELGDEARAEKQSELERTRRRLERPDFFERLGEDELPDDLEWTTNLDDPDLGSPEAKKGGTLHSFFEGMTFPASIRSVGKEANNSFRAQHWDDVEMALVSIHPNTRNVIPAIADRWAVAEDGQSVYFHIDDEARWSDGTQVTSGDFLMTMYVYLSDYLTPTFYRSYYKEQFWGVASYGPDYLCVRIAYPKPIAPFFANISPFQEEFYREFGPDFESRYNWRTRPTTGAYRIRDEDVQKGRSITLSRVEDWWAGDRKYYRNRFNPDRIEYRLVSDTTKAFEIFLQGDIDLFRIAEAKLWYEQLEVPAVHRGYIERATFYNVYPRSSFGFYPNLTRPPLDNIDVRIGLQHATNWEKVIEIDFRGDVERLHLLNDGFDGISDPSLKTRPYSIEKAREAFARAGYTEAGPDGILRNPEGERLSFEVNYARIPLLNQIMARLKEEAKRAGVELRLDGMDGMASFQKSLRKEHEISYMGWGVGQPMIPDPFQQFHSSAAFMEDGKTPRPMTNNISAFADPEVDPILEQNRNATSMDVVIETSRELERIFHERAIWVPAYKRPYYRAAYWRWVCWPDDFNVKMSDLPDMAHVMWIDTEKKRETLEAMRTGRSFEERNLIFDQYRERPGEGSAATGSGEPVDPEAVAPVAADEAREEEPAPDGSDDNGEEGEE